MKNIPLVDLKAQYKNIKCDIDEAIKAVLTDTNFIMGQQVSDFENLFSEFHASVYSIGVSSGTDALHLALYALGIGKGDEVILPAHTFIATAEVVSWLGAKVVFADIDEKTYTLDPNQLKKLINKKTKAIIPVHIYGHPADLDPIINLANKYQISVIEDCAQAHGALYKDSYVGNFGVFGCFSFYPGKNLGAYGDAGAVITNNKELAEKVRLLRNHGRKEKYIHEIVGFGNRLDTLQAAILIVKLKKLKIWNEKRRKIKSLYNQLLRNVSFIKTPFEASWAQAVYHLYVIRVKDRDNLKNYLNKKGIETGVHYPLPLHLQPAFQSLNYSKGDFPVAEKLSNEILSLPIYPEIRIKNIEYICECIEEFYD